MDPCAARREGDGPDGRRRFPREIVPPVGSWMGEVYPNIQYWNEMEKGGHFAAFEQPELFVQEVRSFFGVCDSSIL